jgi:hypothetical protein
MLTAVKDYMSKQTWVKYCRTVYGAVQTQRPSNPPTLPRARELAYNGHYAMGSFRHAVRHTMAHSLLFCVDSNDMRLVARDGPHRPIR